MLIMCEQREVRVMDGIPFEPNQWDPGIPITFDLTLLATITNRMPAELYNYSYVLALLALHYGDTDSPRISTF